MAEELHCIKCGAKMMLRVATGKLTCVHCGYTLDLAPTKQPESTSTTKKPFRSKFRFFSEDRDPWAVAAFNTGETAVEDGKISEAITAFQHARTLDPKFTEVYLWLAELVSEPKAKREYLTAALDCDPHDLDATRGLMVLDGKLTPEQAQQSYLNSEPLVLKALPVEAHAEALHCPSCGGDLTLNEQTGQVECRFCGYHGVFDQVNPAQEHVRDLTEALIQRNAQRTIWNVGKRVLYCKDCGAEQMLTSSEFTMRCRFCGSTEVITQDALKSFTEPDGVIPFLVIRNAAITAVQEALKSESQQLLNVISQLLNGDSQKIINATIEGVYLPYWIFDAYYQADLIEMVDRVEQQGKTTLNSIFVPAVKSPSPALTSQLGYSLDGVLPYHPDLLAKYPAQLYSIDFAEASLEAIGMGSTRVQQISNPNAQLSHDRAESPRSQVSVAHNVQKMNFQLILVPVWIMTLLEADSEIRSALVNGQTGQVVLGQAHKP